MSKKNHTPEETLAAMEKFMEELPEPKINVLYSGDSIAFYSDEPATEIQYLRSFMDIVAELGDDGFDFSGDEAIEELKGLIEQARKTKDTIKRDKETAESAQASTQKVMSQLTIALRAALRTVAMLKPESWEGRGEQKAAFQNDMKVIENALGTSILQLETELGA